jgi:outer membrane protein TolC
MTWVGLAGCATYHPLPLPQHVQPIASVDRLNGASASATPWNLPAVEQLVLLNNPDLRSARAQHRVARAQMLQAGLLPNPVLGGNVGYLLSGVGDSTAWTAGISEDIKALITLAPRREAAKAAAGQVDATLLWQEWQTIGKARLLYVDIVQGEQLSELLQNSLALLEQRDRRLERSLARGDSELAAMAPLLASTADIRTALNDAQRALLANRHALNALLGVAPDAAFTLDRRVDLPEIDAVDARTSEQTIERRRPDLVALQLGYQSQDAELRAAVLAQFPTLSFGYVGTQDNSRVQNGGPSITVELPLFNRNQGGIAGASATREQLREEYIARVGAAKGQIDALLTEQAQAREQRDLLAPHLQEADRASAQAKSAYAQGNIDNRSYVDLTTASLARHAASIVLQQNFLQQQVALTTLLGSGMPLTLPHDVIDL